MFDIGFPRDWSSLKKLIWLKAINGGGGGAGIWKTVTGTLIHITDALASPMQKCEVTIEPIQDLHGQDAPYPAGGGVNLVNLPTATITEAKSVYGIIDLDIPIPAGTYTVGITTSSNAAWILSLRDASGTTITSFASAGTTTGRQTVTGSTNETAYKISVYVNAATTISEIQLEEGSTASPYKPFSNICPITGWTGANAYVTGVNVWDEEWEVGTIASGINSSSSVTLRSKGYIEVQPNTEYYFVAPSNSQKFVFYYDENKTWLGSQTSVEYQRLFTTPNGCYYIRFAYQYYIQDYTTYNHDISINYPSTDTSYHAYSGTTASVTFPDTVYGGKYEFVSGSGTGDRGKKILNGSEDWSIYVGQNGFLLSVPDMANLGNINLMAQASKASWLKVNKSLSEYGIVFNTNKYIYCCHITDNIAAITDMDSWKAFLAENPLEITYPLAEPFEIQLTPQQISTLKGENNVWSNSNGDTTIIYKAKAE